MTLEEAQVAKKRTWRRKLAIQPGMSLLDIGSGWGGLGLTLAQEFGAQVTGVTLSTEQLALARSGRRRRVSPTGRFQLTDYRDVAGPFDRIVSVGMLEHVGAPNFRSISSR
jgi:cyclopropane-fatty-acyl-phospholipid synthase